MAKPPALFECSYPACSLGAVGEPGRFTRGATQDQITLLTGKPPDGLEKGVDYGDGVCPNCGQLGTEVEA